MEKDVVVIKDYEEPEDIDFSTDEQQYREFDPTTGSWGDWSEE